MLDALQLGIQLSPLQRVVLSPTRCRLVSRYLPEQGPPGLTSPVEAASWWQLHKPQVEVGLLPILLRSSIERADWLPGHRLDVLQFFHITFSEGLRYRH